MSVPYHRATVELRKASSVVVCAHVRPDGDAIGATLGLTLALRDAGISAVPTLADATPAPATYEFLPGFGLYVPASELEVPDAFVSLDTPNLDRLGEARRLAEGARVLIVVDHHPDAQEFGTINLLDAAAASTSQMVWRMLRPLDVPVAPEVAQCLYVGLLTDTGRFQYANTDPQALRDAAEMLEAGADPAELARLIYQNRSQSALALQARAMGRLTLANSGLVAYAWVEEDDFRVTHAREEETEHLIDEVRALGGIEIAALLRVANGQVRVNLRAKTGFNVGAVARVFGGGGHAPAAGFTAEGTLDDVLQRLLPMLPGAKP